MHAVAAALPGPRAAAVRECPICIDDVNVNLAAWTPCCTTAFHEGCLARVKFCPMCRTRIGPEVVDLVTEASEDGEEEVSMSDEEESTSDEDSLCQFIVDDATSDSDASWRE